MFGFDRRGPFEDLFTIQREFDRLFTGMWRDMARQGQGWSSQAQVRSGADDWQVSIPLPGIDPSHVTVETAGSVITVRAEAPSESGEGAPIRYEQSLALPAFLDLDRISATCRHGLLRLTVPVKDSVKPRRIPIQLTAEPERQLTGAAA